MAGASFNIRVPHAVTHDKVGDYFITELEKGGFKLYYNDVYEIYSTIDFRKSGFKYNLVIVQKDGRLDISASVYCNLASLFAPRKRVQQQDYFNDCVKRILSGYPGIAILN
jgi:hypothetical protein